MLTVTHYVPLNVALTVAAGASVLQPDWHRKAAYVAFNGASAGTIQVQISPDGTAWFNKGTALTADGFVEINEACRAVRLNTTVAVVGGPPTAFLAGN